MKLKTTEEIKPKITGEIQLKIASDKIENNNRRKRKVQPTKGSDIISVGNIHQ